MQTLLRDTPLIVSSRTIAVGPADSGQMIALRLGDRLVIDVISAPGVSWRIRGGMPILTSTTPRPGESAFVLTAAQLGRIGVDLVPSGLAQSMPRPIRLIACVS